MIYILLISLVILLIISLYISKKDVFSPWTISISMFLVSSSIAALNIDLWGDISSVTVIIIILGLIFFGLGEILTRSVLSKLLNSKKNSNKYSKERTLFPIHVPGIIISIVLIFFIVTFILMFRETYQMSILAGNPQGVSTMMIYARNAQVEGMSFSNFVSLLYNLSFSISYYLCFVYLYNQIIFEKKSNVLLIPIFIFLIMSYLPTGRTLYINFIATNLMMYFLLLRIKQYGKNIRISKALVYGLIALIAFFVLFIFLGTFTAKTNLENGVEKISIYAGSSIKALDIYLQQPNNNGAEAFGQETLINIYGFLSKINISVPVTSRHLEFVQFGDYLTTNIYTALRRYINDYGVVGMVMLQYLIGCFFGGFYFIVKYLKVNLIWILIYSYFFYALVMQSIDDIFLSEMLNYVTIFRIIVIFIFSWLIKLLNYRQTKQILLDDYKLESL